MAGQVNENESQFVIEVCLAEERDGFVVQPFERKTNEQCWAMFSNVYKKIQSSKDKVDVMRIILGCEQRCAVNLGFRCVTL